MCISPHLRHLPDVKTQYITSLLNVNNTHFRTMQCYSIPMCNVDSELTNHNYQYNAFYDVLYLALLKCIIFAYLDR